MANPDVEGYMPDSPLGAYVLFDSWDDYQSAMIPAALTYFIDLKYRTDHAQDPNFTDEKDPLFRGLRFLFKRAIEINYRNQVTGNNLQYLTAKVKSSIVAKMKSSGAVDA